MSTNNRIGRNPFDKKPKASAQETQNTKAPLPKETVKTKKSVRAIEVLQTELNLSTAPLASAEPVLKVSDKKKISDKGAEEIRKAEHEEQIIGELIDLSEENWQPLSMVPAYFFKQLFSRWI